MNDVEFYVSKSIECHYQNFKKKKIIHLYVNLQLQYIFQLRIIEIYALIIIRIKFKTLQEVLV